MARRRRGNREGTIIQRKDGRWCAMMDLGWIDGKRRRKCWYGVTRAEVATKLSDEIAARNHGANTPRGRLTVGQYMTTWLESMRPIAGSAVQADDQPGVRIRTWQNYELIVRAHIVPALGQVQLSKLTRDAVKAFLNNRTRTGLSITTVRHIRGVLRQALESAVESSHIVINAADGRKLLKKGRRKPKINPLTAEQVQRMLAAAVGTRLEVFLRVAVRCGLRRGEVLGLQWSDINLAARTLTVERAIQRIKGQPLTAGPTKTEESRRVIPMPEDVAIALESHRVAQAELRLQTGAAWHDQGLVFPNTIGRPFEPRLIHTKFKQVLKKAELPGATRVHDLRHTTITALLEQDAELFSVSRLAGHSTIATTADLYGHWTDRMKRRLAEKMNAVGQA
ncbi:MAG: site-specific integrase [Candidatus Binataceae bacterium]